MVTKVRWPLYVSRKANRLISFQFGAAFILLVVACLAELSRAPSTVQTEQQQQRAAETMMRALSVVKKEKQARGLSISPVEDPNATGLIGLDLTDLTTTQGALRAKRTATNPAFAALVVHLLHKAGVKPGDSIAVAFSSSFPALNIAVLSAAHALDLDPVIVSSVGASSWGANIPEFTWLDMEAVLAREKIWPYRSAAASLGGIVETKGGLDGTGIERGMEAIRRNDVFFLDEIGMPGHLEKEIQERINFYDGKRKRYAAFINVGGGIVSLGWLPEAAKLETGLLRRVPDTHNPERGMIFRLKERGMPVIHLLNIERLASLYNLPIDPIPLPVYQEDPFGQKSFWQNFLLKGGLVLFIFLISIVLHACSLREKKRLSAEEGSLRGGG